jgi:putative endonuclease
VAAVQPRRGQPARSARSCAPASAPARTDGRRRLGLLGEELAAAHFQRLGFSVLARNARTRHGEIDLIVFDGQTLVFVEVKTRRTGSLRSRPEPLAWLRPRQRVRLRRLAVAWLSAAGHDGERRSRPAARTIRFDAVGVIVDGAGGLLCLEHLEGAW